MFDSSSRYFSLKTLSVEVVEGEEGTREVRYVERRFLPQADTMTVMAEHTVNQSDRLDNITARYLGDPIQFWRVCDANTVMRPAELTDELGRVIRIAVPNL